jgi:D-ribose pyranase
MLKSGILNPAINSLISRIRHTNTLVIADRGFPYWPQIETIDISLIDDVPKVADVYRAIEANFVIGRVFAAEEFLANNSKTVVDAFRVMLGEIAITYEPHVEFKRRVPGAIGLIRTGDATPYSNLILESA